MESVVSMHVRSLTICKLLLLLGSVVAVVSPGANGQAAGQTATGAAQFDAPAIQALLREVEANQKAATAKIEFYSYLLKQTEHQLNDNGEATKIRVHEYRVFPRRQGLPVSVMLSENGEALSPEKLRKAQANANKEWQKYRKNPPKIAESKAPQWFETLDFTVLPPERLEGRDVMVFSFRPRAGLSPKESGNQFRSALQGQLWIDPAEKMTLKFQAELTRDYGVGGLSGWLASLKPGTAITIENTRLENGLWVLKRDEFSSILRERVVLVLPQTSRGRMVEERSHYRPFDPDVKDLFAGQ